MTLKMGDASSKEHEWKAYRHKRDERAKASEVSIRETYCRRNDFVQPNGRDLKRPTEEVAEEKHGGEVVHYTVENRRKRGG